MSLIVDIEKKLGSFTLRSKFETDKGTMALLGASGCGKSVTLKCIAGIMTPDRGRIVLDGETLFDSDRRIDLTPQQRRVGYLFQQYALFPNMTVAQNIQCGIRLADWDIVLPLAAPAEQFTVAIPDSALSLGRGPYTARVCRVIRDLNATVVLLQPENVPDAPFLRAAMSGAETITPGQLLPFALLPDQCLAYPS